MKIILIVSLLFTFGVAIAEQIEITCKPKSEMDHKPVFSIFKEDNGCYTSMIQIEHLISELPNHSQPTAFLRAIRTAKGCEVEMLQTATDYDLVKKVNFKLVQKGDEVQLELKDKSNSLNGAICIISNDLKEKMKNCAFDDIQTRAYFSCESKINVNTQIITKIWGTQNNECIHREIIQREYKKTAKSLIIDSESTVERRDVNIDAVAEDKSCKVTFKEIYPSENHAFDMRINTKNKVGFINKSILLNGENIGELPPVFQKVNCEVEKSISEQVKKCNFERITATPAQTHSSNSGKSKSHNQQ
jgi:hypothetical protein